MIIDNILKNHHQHWRMINNYHVFYKIFIFSRFFFNECHYSKDRTVNYFLAAKEDIYASNEQVNMANLGSLGGGWKQEREPS